MKTKEYKKMEYVKKEMSFYELFRNVKPPRNREYMKYIVSKNWCCVCGCKSRPIEAHHEDPPGTKTMGQKVTDYLCVPLCTDCHTKRHGAITKEKLVEMKQKMRKIQPRLLTSWIEKKYGWETPIVTLLQLIFRYDANEKLKEIGDSLI